MTYRYAAELATQIVDYLKPACERIEVAGSIRRQLAQVGDIEIVAVPTLSPDLLGEASETRPIDELLEKAVKAQRLGIVQGHRPGARNPRYIILNRSKPPQLDLFLVPAEEWGVAFAIRTGPAPYSRLLVTERYRGGRLADGLRVHGNRLWRQRPRDEPEELLETPEESDFLQWCGGWHHPRERGQGRRAQAPPSVMPEGITPGFQASSESTP